MKRPIPWIAIGASVLLWSCADEDVPLDPDSGEEMRSDAYEEMRSDVVEQVGDVEATWDDHSGGPDAEGDGEPDAGDVPEGYVCFENPGENCGPGCDLLPEQPPCCDDSQLTWRYGGGGPYAGGPGHTEELAGYYPPLPPYVRSSDEQNPFATITSVQRTAVATWFEYEVDFVPPAPAEPFTIRRVMYSDRIAWPEPGASIEWDLDSIPGWRTLDSDGEVVSIYNDVSSQSQDEVLGVTISQSPTPRCRAILGDMCYPGIDLYAVDVMFADGSTRSLLNGETLVFEHDEVDYLLVGFGRADQSPVFSSCTNHLGDARYEIHRLD